MIQFSTLPLLGWQPTVAQAAEVEAVTGVAFADLFADGIPADDSLPSDPQPNDPLPIAETVPDAAFALPLALVWQQPLPPLALPLVATPPDAQTEDPMPRTMAPPAPAVAMDMPLPSPMAPPVTVTTPQTETAPTTQVPQQHIFHGAKAAPPLAAPDNLRARPDPLAQTRPNPAQNLIAPALDPGQPYSAPAALPAQDIMVAMPDTTASVPGDPAIEPRRSESPAERAFMVQTTMPMPNSPPLAAAPSAPTKPIAVQKPATIQEVVPESHADPIASAPEAEPPQTRTQTPLPRQSLPTPAEPTAPSLPPTTDPAIVAPATKITPPVETRAPLTKAASDAEPAPQDTDLPPLDPMQTAVPVAQWGIDAAARPEPFIPPPLAQITATPVALPAMPNPHPAPLAPTLAKIAHDTKTGAVELSLAPAELGRLHMAITHDGDQVRVTLTAERPETLDLLRRNADQLSQEFRQAGFAGSSLSFGQWGSGNSPPAQPMPDTTLPPAPPETTLISTPRPSAPNPSLGGSGLDLRL